MHDRVADVLAQRVALDSGAGLAIFVSAAFHAGAGALAIWSAMHQPPPQTVTLVNIKLAAAPRAIAPMTPAKPEAPKREPRIEPPKPVPPVPVATPPVTATTPPPPKNAVPMSAFGRSTKPGADNIPAPPVPAPAPATSTAPAVPIGGAGVTGIEGGDFPYTIYIERMQTLIGKNWFRPPQVAGDVETTVYFRVERDGTIRDAKTETPSRNATFDRAALRAVIESSPLPPLPFAYNGNYLGVHLKFR
jgi:TonB family protein